MKYLYLTLSLTFVLFCYFQLNDPDPLRWIGIYGYMAIILGLGFFNIKNKYLIYVGYLLAASGIVLLFPSFIDWVNIEKGQNLMQRMDNSKMYIEETREFLGSLICIASISLLWIKTKK